MTADTYAQQAPKATGPSNPALNPSAFERGWSLAAPDEKMGMTVGGTYMKTGLLVIILILGGAFGWSQVSIVQVRGADMALQPSWTWLMVLLTLGLGIYGAVAFRSAAIVGPLYALCEGTLLGIAAAFYNLEYDGIVLQAIVATVAVFAATLLLYSTGKLRVSGKLALLVIVGITAIALIWLVAWILSWFGIYFRFLYAPTPLGIGLSLLIVVLGVLNLPINYQFVEHAAAVGSPKFMEWYGAYGLLLALIWMYISILRLLAILRR
ncbi:MAG: Bax inhibitor-1/YccA family protein [Chloroflexi bacterium]|nr:Bax inhibitor-1/YccA family protein [Chloroflexota bacterium]